MTDDPLGLTREQRAYSDASLELDQNSPTWWTKDYRDGIALIRAAEKLREEDTTDDRGPGPVPPLDLCP